MQATLGMKAPAAAKPTLKAENIMYWAVTGLFCLQMSFTAYAQLRLPQLPAEFARLAARGESK